MVEILKQKQYVPMPMARQVIIIWAGVNGYLDDIVNDNIADFEAKFLEFCSKEYPDIEHGIEKEKALSDAILGNLKEAIEKFKAQYSA